MNQVEIFFGQNPFQRFPEVGTVELFKRFVEVGRNGLELAAQDRFEALAERSSLPRLLEFITGLDKADQSQTVFVRDAPQELKDPARPSVPAQMGKVGTDDENPGVNSLSLTVALGMKEVQISQRPFCPLQKLPVRVTPSRFTGSPEKGSGCPGQSSEITSQGYLPADSKWIEQKMGEERGQLEVPPQVPQLPLLGHLLNLAFVEEPQGAASMLVDDLTGSRKQYPETPSPGPVAQVGVLHIAGRENGSEALQPEKIVSAECGRPSTRPQNRQETTLFMSLPDGFVTEVKTAVFKVATRVARLLAPSPDWKKNLGADSKDIGIHKWLQERGQERRIHDHVVVQENHDVVSSRSHSAIVSFSKSEVAVQLQNLYARKMLSNPAHAVVAASVVDHQHLVVPAIGFDGADHGRQALFEEFTAIPIQDHDRATIPRGMTQRKGATNGSQEERNKLSQRSRDQ
jgi:hypothetical protein